MGVQVKIRPDKTVSYEVVQQRRAGKTYGQVTEEMAGKTYYDDWRMFWDLVPGETFQVGGYSITEDTTPIAAGDSQGSVGSFTFSVPAPDPYAPMREGYRTLSRFGSDFFVGQTVEISDTRYGSVRGTIRSTGRDQDGSWEFTGVTRLDLLNVYDIQAQPFQGTLREAFRYYLGLAGVKDGWTVDPAVANYPVTAPGFTGELWYYIKQMATAFDSEVALVNGVITLRPIRTRIALQGRDISRTSAREIGTLAQSVEVYKYNSYWINDELVYPPGGWDSSVEVLNVNAGEESEYQLELSASVSSIRQPVMETNVAAGYDLSSVYTVVADDGLPVSPALWRERGGRLTVTINPDTTTLTVKLRGATGVPTSDGTAATNFSIALASDETGNRYSTLRIVGTGVAYKKEAKRVRTGIPSSKTATEVGVTIDNPFISTNDQLYTAGTRAARQYAGNPATVSGSVVAVSRGEGNVFGNVGGLRIWDKKTNRYYRIRSAQITPEEIRFDGEEDITWRDKENTRSGETYAEDQAEREGMTYFQDQVAGLT